jgi:hypothetical protein
MEGELANGSPPAISSRPSDVVHRCLVSTLIWLAEGVVGLFPLIGHEIIVAVVGSAPRPFPCFQTGQDASICYRMIEGPQREICILAVVFSGITLLNMLPFGHNQGARFTEFTYGLFLLTLCSMFTASLLYAGMFVVDDPSERLNEVVGWTLAFALVSSLALTIEKAIYGH